jgi:Arc/MetJ-type ribon-helix-helix transcriptional regulator
MNTRVNVNIPEALFNKSQALVEKGFFSNFSELVRDGIREKVKEYDNIIVNENEKKLFTMLKKANEKGELLTEDEMKKHGLKL